MDLNQFSTVDIVLDKANDNFIQKQTISAGDRDGRSLTLQVTDAGSIGEVPGLTANLLWTNHSSGLSDLSAFSVVDRTTSVFKIDYPQNMLTAGKVTAQIQLLHNGKVTHSKKFEIIVLDIAGKLKGVLQTAEYTALVEALAKTNQFESDVRKLQINKADKTDVSENLGKKADKTEVSQWLEKKADKTEVNALLGIKADKTYVDSMLSSIASGGPKELFYSLAALKSKYPNGAEGTYLVFDAIHEDGAHAYMWKDGSWIDLGLYKSDGIADSSVGSAELMDGSINYNHLDFLKVSANRFDYSKLQPNGFHNYTTGEWSENGSYDTSGKIPCRPGQIWTSKSTRWVCYFDKKANFVSGGFVTGSSDILKTFTIPSGAYYFEVTCQKHNTPKQQIEQSASLSDFNEFELKIDNLKIEIDSVNDIKNDSLTIDKMEFIETGKNLFNPNVAISGYYINPTTGKLNEAANYVTSQLIPIYGRRIGLQKIKFYALFNKRGEYLSGETLSADKLIAENEANAFIRVSPTSGMEGSAQVEYDEITAFEAYKAVLKGVSTESELNDKPSINLPSKIFATTNKQIEIFKNNITLNSDVEFRWGRGIQGEKSYRETFDDTTDKNLSVELYKDAKLINSKPVKIKVSDPRADNIKVLLLGDSTVDSLTTEPPSQARLGYHMLQEMGDNLTLIGSRGLGTSKHEGRGGWTAKDYRSNKTDVTGANPFYNPTTYDFDFSYYMSQTGFDVPDAVVIQLGINDLFNYTSDDTALVKVNEFISDIEYIANNIKSYNSAIKVIYNIAIPPTQKIDIFAETYQQYNLPQWRYKRNNNLLASKAIAAFDDSKTVILNAINAIINVFCNIRDGVHPDDLGYKQIASQIVDCLNSL